eukprot:gene1409-1532_t
MKEKENQSLYSALLYGVINALMVTPVSISFCAIIFCHPAFLPHLPQLVKLVLFSSAMHQLCFTLCSSLPFAVGQVQDAGLIFLSAMAASIAKGCQASGQADALLPTTLVVLALCTAALGLLLIATAKLRLASFVQYLPMPVVGGYLAFIGFFCGEAGLAMMANVTIHTKADWLQFLDPQVAKLYLPGLAGGVSIYLLLRRLRNPFVLPACMAAILALFYLAVYASGYSLDEMREAGWISPLTPSESALDAWKLYDISQVDWHYLPSQLPSLLALYLVVAFSSSLDIAAIEMELGLPLDYNTELFTVGVANLASGCLGGYTGSYIFSQTLFTLRNGVGSRAAGWVVVLVELLFVVLPFPVFAYLPKLFFGSLLVFISADLLCEWLVAARRKMGGADYLLCLASFLAIQCYGIEVGMALGVVAAMMAFVARVAGRPRHTLLSVTTLPCSTVVRTFEERAVLIANRGKIVSIELKGYIFFGTAVRVLEEIVSRIDSSIPSYDNSHSSVMGWPRGAMDARHPLQALPLPSSTTEGVRRVLGNAHLHLSTDSRDLLANRGLAAAPPTSTSWAVGEEVASSGSGAVGLPAASSDTFALSLEEPQEKEEEEEESNRLHRLAVDQLLASSRDDTPQEVQKHLGRPPLAPSSSSCSSSHSGSFSKASLPRPSGLKAYHSSYADMQSLLANPPPPPPPAPVASISSSRDAMNDSETQPAEEEEQEEVHTEYLILDCSQLLGIDATAARSCFRSLVNLLREARVVVVFAQLSSEVEQLLRAHDVVTKQAVVISHLDDAIEWCENQVLLSNVKRLRRGLERSLSDAMGRGADHFSAAHHLRQAQLPSRSSSSLLALPSSPSLRSLPTHLSSSSTTDDPLRPLRIILKDYLEVGSRSSSSSFSSSLYSSLQRGRGLRDYFQQEVFVFQEVIFEVGQASDKVFFIEKGTVEIVAISPAHVSRVNKVCAGGAFGEADFFLGRRHAVRALASSHEGETVCWTISRDAFAAMRRDHPDLFVAVQHSLCKSLSIAATWSMFALHPTTASLSDYPPPPATTIESMV